MYANLYSKLRSRPPFADFHVNLRDGTTRIFRCQRMEGTADYADCRRLAERAASLLTLPG